MRTMMSGVSLTMAEMAPGVALPLVKGVTYSLHPTVSPREPYVERTDSNPDCILQQWLWGTFEVRATVLDNRGRTLPASKCRSSHRSSTALR
jgi:hypothetical protein